MGPETRSPTYASNPGLKKKKKPIQCPHWEAQDDVTDTALKELECQPFIENHRTKPHHTLSVWEQSSRGPQLCMEQAVNQHLAFD